jgi:hypothetical protein
MAKIIVFTLCLFGVSRAAFLGIGNQVFEAGLNLNPSNTVSIGYGLDIIPDAGFAPNFNDSPIYNSHFLIRYQYQIYKANKFSTGLGLSIKGHMPFKSGGAEDNSRAVVALFVEPEYMITKRFGVFGTGNVLSYIHQSGNHERDGAFEITPEFLSPDINLGIRFKFGKF